VWPRRGGARRLLEVIQDPESIRKVLGSLGLSLELPALAGARVAPAAAGTGWDPWWASGTALL
jgi:hypothetical protein